MAQRMQYRTRQQDELLSYLKTVAGKHVTVADVCEHFRSIGAAIGTTTVYRQMDNLVARGLVNKYVTDGVNAACYEYIAPVENCCRPVCYHCKCEQCGKLIHMECEEIAALREHMKAKHGFVIDPLRTVFYGLCEECAANEKS